MPSNLINSSDGVRFIESNRDNIDLSSAMREPVLSVLALAAILAIGLALSLNSIPSRMDFFDNSKGGIDIVYSFLSKKTVTIICASTFGGLVMVGLLGVVLPLRHDMKQYRERKRLDLTLNSVLLADEVRKKIDYRSITMIASLAIIGCLGIIISFAARGGQVNVVQADQIHISNEATVSFFKEKAESIFGDHSLWRDMLPGYRPNNALTTFDFRQYSSVGEYNIRSTVRCTFSDELGLMLVALIPGTIALLGALIGVYRDLIKDQSKRLQAKRNRHWDEVTDRLKLNSFREKLKERLLTGSKEGVVALLDDLGDEALRALVFTNILTQTEAQSLYQKLFLQEEIAATLTEYLPKDLANLVMSKLE